VSTALAHRSAFGPAFGHAHDIAALAFAERFTGQLPSIRFASDKRRGADAQSPGGIFGSGFESKGCPVLEGSTMRRPEFQGHLHLRTGSI